MNKSIFLIAGFVFSISALAQSEKFTGPSIGINGGYNAETYTKSSVIYSQGHTNNTYNLNATYTLALTPEWVVGTGITYDLNSTTLATAANTGNNDYTMNSHYSLNLEPGYVFNESTLGYFKLAYNRGTIKNSYYSLNQPVTGTGYGFGAKSLISKNLFLNFEMQQTKYGSYTYVTTVLTHTTTSATVGIGYKF